MPSHRIDRISEDMKRELSDILRELKDPRISGLLSIVRVDVSGDLSYAKVYISAMEGLARAQKAVEGLTSAAGYIRTELGSRLSLRHVPKLQFIASDSIAYSAEISRKLEELKQQSALHDAPGKEQPE